MTKNNNNLDLEHFKKKLLAEEKTLLDELKGVSTRNPNNPNDWEAKTEDMNILKADRNEVADKFASFEGDAAILKKLEPQLNEVKLALSKIEKGEYGICEVCGKPIQIERLEANPAARTCMEHL